MAKKHWFMASVAVAAMMTSGALAQQVTQPEMFPFVLPWDDASASVTDMSGLLDKPAGKSGFVAVKEGRLFVGDKRIRFFGVNNSFTANFPTHEEAEKIAARMAKFGINCVRFHHMDSSWYPRGLVEKDGVTLNKDYLDRMDYFVAQLKAHGIYSNINLHVGRHYPGEPDAPKKNHYFKGLDQFVPRMIALQKDYARDLLTHVNPYTKTAYVDEPAVAFVEINNENALIHSWWNGHFEGLAPAHAEELSRQWNAWLAAHYKDSAAVRKAWQEGGQDEGAQMLTQDFARWHMEQHHGAQASVTVVKGKENLPPALAGDESASAVKFVVSKPGNESWHAQYVHPHFAIQKGQTYVAELWARSSGRRDAALVVGQAHDPYQLFGNRTLQLTDQWKKFSLYFKADQDDDRARLLISGLGKSGGDCQIAGVTLRIAGIDGLAAKEQIGNVEPFAKDRMVQRTLAAQKDWIKFLYETEEKYWLGMQEYLKKDLKCKSLIVGTQMGYSPFPIQAKLDVVDVHAYWQHPHFPKNDWSDVDWIVRNKSMVSAPGAGELGRIAGTRVYGKPYICTEYSHPAPNSFSSEGLLMAAAFAAQQDWDGIFAYSYSHDVEAGKSGKISGFFDIAQHPTKMATLPAAVAMFVRGDVAAWNHQDVVPTAMPTMNEVLEQVRGKGPSPRVSSFVPNSPASELWDPISIAIEGSVESKSSQIKLQWIPQISWAAHKGLVTFHSDRSAGVLGYADNTEHRLGRRWLDTPPGNLISVERRTPANWVAGKPPFDKRWCTITATVMEGKDFASARRVLIVATGTAENTGMGWKDAEKTTVGRDWGKAPSLVEGIDAVITLPAEGMKVWALDERGQRKEEVPVVKDAAGSRFEIGPKYRTLWYEAGR